MPTQTVPGRFRPRVNHDKAAALVAEIAHAFAYRRKHHIAHTGHTVNRLLAAVSVLLERPVTFADDPKTPP